METDTRHIGQASHCLLRHVCHRSNDEHHQLIDDDYRRMVALTFDWPILDGYTPFDYNHKCGKIPAIPFQDELQTTRKSP